MLTNSLVFLFITEYILLFDFNFIEGCKFFRYKTVEK